MTRILEELAEEECKLEMTPMIDVTFLLLIFFMCTIKFKTLEGKLSANLPKDVGVNPEPSQPREDIEIGISIVHPGTKLDARHDGKWSGGKARFTYSADRVVRYTIGPRESTQLGDIGRRLEVLHAADPERAATISARNGVVYEEVVQVVDLCLQAQLEEITFVGDFD